MFSTKNMHSVQNEQSIEMQNYYRWIGHYKNIVSDSLCDNIISTDFNYAESTYSNHGGLSKHSKERVKMDEIWIRKDHVFYEELNHAVTNVAERYSKEVKKAKRDFTVHKTTDFRVNKYKKGGYMSLHCDNIHHSHGQQYGYPQASVLLFLNDDFEGGEFITSTGFVLKPKQGMLTFFNGSKIIHGTRRTLSKDRKTLIFWWK
jgi:hypothetical protein